MRNGSACEYVLRTSLHVYAAAFAYINSFFLYLYTTVFLCQTHSLTRIASLSVPLFLSLSHFYFLNLKIVVRFILLFHISWPRLISSVSPPPHTTQLVAFELLSSYKLCNVFLFRRPTNAFSFLFFLCCLVRSVIFLDNVTVLCCAVCLLLFSVSFSFVPFVRSFHLYFTSSSAHIFILNIF